MFTSFVKEEGVLNKKTFLDCEVQFNLFHRIIEGKELIALKTKDGNVIAMQNPGHAMWIWVNEVLEGLEVNNVVNSLCNIIKDNNISEISGQVEIVKRIAKQYSNLFGVSYKISMRMQSYKCLEVIRPQNVQGELIRAELCHVGIVAEYCKGFAFDSFEKIVTKESQVSGAESLVKSGDLFLWQVNNNVVSMANIAHRSMRHARINSVYTPNEQRKKGYACALMAELSFNVLKERLTPMLYTDITNPDSNKVYKSIGYKECGRIDEIHFV
ncbi:MAG: GNAT family N-acetyltransferase [Clostridium sp.]|uniref:GNAT family N-acetyltransferase n=1 Tax=Clostridium sp. TaxID=1506 RepID=UPI003D6C9F76